MSVFFFNLLTVHFAPSLTLKILYLSRMGTSFARLGTMINYNITHNLERHNLNPESPRKEDKMLSHEIHFTSLSFSISFPAGLSPHTDSAKTDSHISVHLLP